MVRTEIPTTYGQLVVGDVLWLDDQPYTVKSYSAAVRYPDTYTVGIADQAGNRKVLVQASSDPVYRQHRTN